MGKNIDITNEYFKDVNDLVKEIDRKEESTLWKKAKKGDMEAREKLIKMHLRLSISTAKRFLRPGMELMDLVEEGNEGLLQAIEKFDPKLGYRFSTYAIHWIEQAIRRAVEESSSIIKIPSHAWDNVRLWSKTWEELKNELKREPTLKEMAKKLKLSAKKVRSILDTLNVAYGMESLTATISEDDSITLEDTITDDGKGNPDIILSNLSTNEDLLKIMNEIPERDREILFLRYGVNSEEPYTLSEVAKKLNISRERVRQIEERAVRQVRKRAIELGLIEEQEIVKQNTKIYVGMEVKQKTDILGNKVKNNPLDILLKKVKINNKTNKKSIKKSKK